VESAPFDWLGFGAFLSAKHSANFIQRDADVLVYEHIGWNSLAWSKI
jgi:hypothetical protein